MQIPVVIERPTAVVTPAEARAAKVFSASDGDSYVSMLLAIAQAQIEGSYGRYGMAIGRQTLEITLPAHCSVDVTDLPLPPYISTVSETLSDDGRSRRFRWLAGYGGDEPAQLVPVQIKHAIIMMAGALRDAVPDDEGAVKSKTIDGVGRWDYSLPDGAADAMRRVADSLLEPFKTMRV